MGETGCGDSGTTKPAESLVGDSAGRERTETDGSMKSAYSKQNPAEARDQFTVLPPLTMVRS